MSTSIRNMDIAVIGDMELVSTLRLAGLRKTRAIQGERNLVEDIRKSLDEFVNDPEVGVVVIMEDYAEMVESTLANLRQAKGVLPVIVQVPSKRGTRYPDVVGYYKHNYVLPNTSTFVDSLLRRDGTFLVNHSYLVSIVRTTNNSW